MRPPFGVLSRVLLWGSYKSCPTDGRDALEAFFICEGLHLLVALQQPAREAGERATLRADLEQKATLGSHRK